MKIKSLTIWIIATLSIFACTLGQAPPERSFPEPAPVINADSPPQTDAPLMPPSGNVILPEHLSYLGAFRLPDASGGSNWEYSGHGLTYYPYGDQAQNKDDFVGSLFGFGHDQQLQRIRN